MDSVTAFVTNNEAPIRMGFFIGVLAVMAVWEIFAPKRALQQNSTLDQ